MRESRRSFLKTSGAMLVVAIDPPRVLAAGAPAPADPHIRIAPGGAITLVTPKAEMGQGQWTSWAMVVADGLGVPLAAVRVEPAPADPARYRDPLLEKQATFGSTGIAAYEKNLREAARLARERLPAGGAAPGAIVGTKVHRIDSPEKVDGRARYGLDVSLPGMRTALFVAAPTPGARATGTNAAALEGREGVERVLPVTGGVAIVARDFWSARRARAALKVDWEGPAPAFRDNESLRAHHTALLGQPGVVVAKAGQATPAEGEVVVSADYHAPFLAHLTMEPLNCTARRTADGGLELWVGTQDTEQALKVAQAATGLEPARIAIHTLLLGGGFGRRAATDFILPAIEAATQVKQPVKLVVERADELKAGRFRPAAAARLSAAIKDGRISRLEAKTTCASVSKPFFGGNQKNANGEYDFFGVQGMSLRAWRIPAREVRWVESDSPFPVWIWRGVGYSQNVFFVESFVDELARAAKADPLDFRLAHAADARITRALEKAAAESGWRTPAPAGRARGIAAFVHEKLVHVLVAEVSLAAGRPRVHRVTSVVDCGRVVNPDAVEAQCQGGVMMGLSEALDGGIRFADGAVSQSNFHDYRVLRMSEAPAVSVHLLQGIDEVVGVGEFTNVLVAPAVANALAALTGKRQRSLPLASSA